MREVTDEQFRAAGFTAAARQFPLSDRAAAWLAQFNGITVEQMPPAWFYAPNAYMQAWLDDAALLAAMQTSEVPAKRSNDTPLESA